MVKEYLNKRYAGIGSRSTPKVVLKEMKNTAIKLAEIGFELYSGGASGADKAFEEGSKEGGGSQRIFYPNENYDPKVWEKALEIASRMHESGDVSKVKGTNLLTRNVFQILGEDLNSPVSFVLCYCPRDKLGKLKGGTRLGINLAKENKIPILNLYDISYTEMRSELIKLICKTSIEK